MGALSVIGGFLSGNNGNDDLLPDRGDELRLRRADNDALVATYHKGDGTVKLSRTEYPNGTVHETRTYKKPK